MSLPGSCEFFPLALTVSEADRQVQSGRFQSVLCFIVNMLENCETISLGSLLILFILEDLSPFLSIYICASVLKVNYLNFSISFISRLHRAQCAIKQTQVTVQKIGKEIEEKLRLTSTSNELVGLYILSV